MEHTPGPWRQGNYPHTVVSESALGIDIIGATDEGAVEYYGGNLIAESVSTRNVPIIAAAPEMKEALEAAYLVLTSQETKPEIMANTIAMVREALWKATARERVKEPEYENN